MEGFIKITAHDNENVTTTEVLTKLVHVSQQDKVALLDAFMAGLHIEDMELIEMLAMRTVLVNKEGAVKRVKNYDHTRVEEPEAPAQEESKEEANPAQHVVIDVNIKQ